MPTFNKASSHLFKKKSFATVNIDKSPRLAERFRVKDLPTLIMFSKGKMYLYRSKHRQVTDLVKFAGGSFQFQKPLPIPKDFTIIQVFFEKDVQGCFADPVPNVCEGAYADLFKPISRYDPRCLLHVLDYEKSYDATIG